MSATFPILMSGILIGLAIAAPVGPIGILCIRRTLRDGPLTGIASGMGAATADGLYGLLAATGLAMSGLLVSHSDMMRLIGGLLLIYLGASTFMRGLKPQPHEAAKTVSAHAPFKAYITTFFLTVANPATILSFVVLISGLAPGKEGGAFGPYFLVAGVFLGSALWWLFLVGLTTALRGLISDTLMRLIDFASGSILAIWGGVMIWKAYQIMV